MTNRVSADNGDSTSPSNVSSDEDFYSQAVEGGILHVTRNGTKQLNIIEAMRIPSVREKLRKFINYDSACENN